MAIYYHIKRRLVDWVEICPKRTRCLNNSYAVDTTKLACLHMFLVHRLPKFNAQRVRRESAEGSLHILHLTAGRKRTLLEKTMPMMAMKKGPICIHIQHCEIDELD